MAIGNWELLHKCFPKHSRMGTARMKYERREYGKKSTEGTKERSPDSLSLPNQNTILINIKWYYFTRYGKKYNEIQLTKKQNGLKYSKNDKSSTLSRHAIKKAL